MLFLFLLLTNLAHADPKYNEAIKTSVNAAAKQSGLEADFLKVKSATNKRIVKWAREKGLATPLSVVSFVAPILYKKQLRIRTGDFVFKYGPGKTALDWQIQF